MFLALDAEYVAFSQALQYMLFKMHDVNLSFCVWCRLFLPLISFILNQKVCRGSFLGLGFSPFAVPHNKVSYMQRRAELFRLKCRLERTLCAQLRGILRTPLRKLLYTAANWVHIIETVASGALLEEKISSMLVIFRGHL